MRKKTKEEFIREAKSIYGDSVIYDKVNYTNSKTKVCLICPKHGEFWQTPNSHLNKHSCPFCANEKRNINRTKTKDDFIYEADTIHNGKYIYTCVDYINNHTKVGIICPVHGMFQQMPYSHLYGIGCPMCAKGIRNIGNKSTTNDFTKKGQTIHNDKYKYTKVNYINNRTKVIITCPIHGDFKQTPNDHLSGCGCPKCNRSKLELEMCKFLTENNVKFVEQYHPQWMGLQSLDFYLPYYKVGIECQGKQHFEEGCTFGGNETMDTILDRDRRKLQICQNNGVKLLYYSNLGIEYPYEVFEDKNKLLEEIKKTQ